MDNVKVVHVTYCGGKSPLPMGRLAMIDRRFFFEYTPDFLHYGLEISPFKLPLKPGVFACKEHVFDGIFGVFNDSLPDGWGRLLLDRKLTKAGINPQLLTPLDRLCYVGKRGMGALQYQPEIEEKKEIKLLTDLDLIADECLQFLENEGDQYVEDLLVMNGSSAGARPKIVVSLLADHQGFQTSQPPYHNEWIIKFHSFLDPDDIGPLEYAYHLMAVAAGLDVPPAKLFKSRKCGGHFGVKRFDRQQHRILHMHTVSGLLHADHRLPSLDYETLMKATLWLTKDIREGEKLLRLAAFNVFAHNRDDHAKNFSFLMDENGTWSLSPAYDLTFSYGPGGEHCTTIMGEGKDPSSTSLLKLAHIGEIKPEKANHIIHHVKQTVAKWPQFAEEAQVTSRSMENIQAELAKIY